MKCTGRWVSSAASSIARVGVMPTPPLIRTSGLSLAVRTNSPDGGNNWMLAPTCNWSCRKLEARPPASRLTLMRYWPLFASADSE
ncbi:hypothetical protein D3C86_2099330 [compost metagenome]